ncbi:hypothetical protein PPYR_02388 [Photinus pyralis]|uniref:Uncharacterized protein n=1 Tax=Photinus pyralis TaxID=7054 RepID=A0A5N4B780_PHOPY|nr:hypothetical protein PPYR_02388 [Photinus pyralis]
MIFNGIQVAALAKLFPPKGRINTKKHWKPSIVECQESIINLVSTCGEIEECINNRIKKLSDLGVTDQPYLIAVGKGFSEITESYVIIDKHVYKSISVLHSLDFLFQSFHVLNARYPLESEHIWLLIERALYKIEHSKIKSPAVLTILKEHENFE